MLRRFDSEHTSGPILRVSTERQEYSIDFQMAGIAAYAEAHGFNICRTYCDEAKSGLDLRRRKELSQLLQDVVGRNQEYRVILVYDVTRWGRFQDPDEAAHYEFLCKSAGVRVHYCAEHFSNNGDIASTILKGLKRVMAGEYSRELSQNVFAGLSRLAKSGFRTGAIPGYGLRRMLVSADGTRKQQLNQGERKSISTDRVILVLVLDGTDNEFVSNQASQLLSQVNLPSGAQASLSPDATPVGEIYRYTLEAPNGFPKVELKAIEDWVVERQFRTVPGIVDVNGFGGTNQAIPGFD